MNARKRNRWMILVIILILGIVYFTNKDNLASFVSEDLPVASLNNSR